MSDFEDLAGAKRVAENGISLVMSREMERLEKAFPGVEFDLHINRIETTEIQSPARSFIYEANITGTI